MAFECFECCISKYGLISNVSIWDSLNIGYTRICGSNHSAVKGNENGHGNPPL